ncbi:MAG: hypothetical protein KGJ23_10115 [Euryarchaeota archaeon]|nr:hypothetical protein [Euryarchaeota archaeon]MDE1836959.1 hypothetical protein [Euryarchaeota archaeon]MDE1881933.1 hypothetical protein [Euryarchaeota archaeon]MDE2045856.1 hypothetical protein [Thermoplasmata archaeon]
MRRLIGAALVVLGLLLLIVGVIETFMVVCPTIWGACEELGSPPLFWGAILFAIGLPLLLLRAPRADPYARLGEPPSRTVARTITAVRLTIIATLLEIVSLLVFWVWLSTPGYWTGINGLVEANLLPVPFTAAALSLEVAAAALWRYSLLEGIASERRMTGPMAPPLRGLRTFYTSVALGIASFSILELSRLPFVFDFLWQTAISWGQSSADAVLESIFLVLAVIAYVMAILGTLVAGETLLRALRAVAPRAELTGVLRGVLIVTGGWVVLLALDVLWYHTVLGPPGVNGLLYLESFLVEAAGPAVVLGGLLVLAHSLRRIRDPPAPGGGIPPWSGPAPPVSTPPPPARSG